MKALVAVVFGVFLLPVLLYFFEPEGGVTEADDAHY